MPRLDWGTSSEGGWLGRFDHLIPERLRLGDPETRRRARLLVAFGLFSVLCGLGDLLIQFEARGWRAVPLISAASFLSLLFLLRLGVLSLGVAGNLTTSLVLGTLIFALLDGRPGLFLSLAATVPVAGALLVGWRSAVAWGAATSAAIWCLFLWGPAARYAPLETIWQATVAVMTLGFAGVLMEVLKDRALAEAEASRRHGEQALRELTTEQERFRALAEKNYAVIAEVDLGGRLLYVNQRVRELYGYRPNELLGRNHLELVHTEDIPVAIEAVKETLGRHRGARLEVRARHKDGHWVWTEVMGSLYRTSAGEDRLIYAARDITAEKTARERLLEAQKLKSLGVLAGGIAHDFNNLLTVIQGYAALISDPQAGPAILRAARRAAELTSQLLAFGRKQELEIRTFDLNRLLTGLEAMIRSLVREDVEVEMRLAPELWGVRADPAKLEQALLNLAANARDAMPEGGRLTVETTNVELDEVAAAGPGVKEGCYVQLTVRDTGLGMDRPTLERAFEPFFTTKQVGRGTGLGLSTVYGIVEQCGGGVLLDSVPGKGTAVTLFLPRCQSQTQEKIDTPSQPISLDFLGRETILVVEDEDSVRELITMSLGRAGYHVLQAPNGAAALELSRRHEGKLSLVITDVIMPGLRGPELAERLLWEQPQLKILFISGYGRDEIGLLQQAEAGGSHGSAGSAQVSFLAKPFKPGQLVKRIAEILELPPHQNPVPAEPENHPPQA